MQGWQHGRGLFKAKISAKKLPFRTPELHYTRKYYSTPNLFFRRSKGARRRRLSARGGGGVGDSHIKVTGMLVAKLKWNPSGRTVGVAQADPYKTKNIRKKTPRHAFCTVLTPLSDTRKSLKNGNFLFQTPQVRPKSAIYTPREGPRASPSLSRGVTPAPRGFWGYSRSNANNMRKNRNPANSSKFSCCTRIPVLGLGRMAVCLGNSENFSLRLLQAFTSGARIFDSK